MFEKGLQQGKRRHKHRKRHHSRHRKKSEHKRHQHYESQIEKIGQVPIINQNDISSSSICPPTKIHPRHRHQQDRCHRLKDKSHSKQKRRMERMLQHLRGGEKMFCGYRRHHKQGHNIRSQMHHGAYFPKFRTQGQIGYTKQISTKTQRQEVIVTDSIVKTTQSPQKITGQSIEYQADIFQTPTNYAKSQNDSNTSARMVYRSGTIPDFISAFINAFFIDSQENKPSSLKRMIRSTINEIAKELLEYCQSFQCLISQILMNLINCGKLTSSSKPNIYNIAKNALNNSEILKSYIIENKILELEKDENHKKKSFLQENVLGFVKPSQIRYKEMPDSFLAEITSSTIKFTIFQTKLRKQIEWLEGPQQSGLEQNKQSPTEQDKLQSLVELIMGNKFNSQIEEQLKQTKIKKEDTGNVQIKAKIQNAIYKKILIYSIRVTLVQSFQDISVIKRYQPKDQNDSRRLKNYSILAKFSKIPYFEDAYFYQKSIYIPSSIKFLSKQQKQPYHSINSNIQQSCRQPSFYIQLVLDLLAFVKSAIDQGIHIELNQQNIFIFDKRLTIKLTNSPEPFEIIKARQIKKKNPQLQKALHFILENQRQYEKHHPTLLSSSKQLNQKSYLLFLRNCRSNIELVIRIFQSIMKLDIFNPVNSKNKDMLAIKLGQIKNMKMELTQLSIEDLRKQYKQAELRLQKSSSLLNEDEQARLLKEAMQSQQFERIEKEKSRENIIQSVLKIKITTISYQICSFFHNKQDNKLGLGVFLAIEQHFKQRVPALSKIYQHIFKKRQCQSQQYFQSSSSESSQEQKSAYQQNFESPSTFLKQLSILAKELKKVNLGQKHSGIIGVNKLIQGKYGIYIHSEGTDQESTISFAQMSTKNAKLLLFKMFLPLEQNQDQIKSTTQVGKEERSFGEKETRDVVKTFLVRIQLAFQRATRSNIKVPLFLLRHLVVETNINQQNYPNILPRLNILHSFLDTNPSNQQKPVYIAQQHHINRLIRNLNLDKEQTHNELIYAIFVFSLVKWKYSQQQYLKKIIEYLQRQSMDIATKGKDYYIKTLRIFLFHLMNKDHSYYYMKTLNKEKYHEIIDEEIVVPLRQGFIMKEKQHINKWLHNIDDFIFNQDPDVSRRNNKFGRNLIGNTYFIFRQTFGMIFFREVSFQISKNFYPKQSLLQLRERIKQSEQNLHDNIFLADLVDRLNYLQLQNMSYLCQKYIDDQTAFQSIQPVVNIQMCPYSELQHRYNAMIKTSNMILQRQLSSAYKPYILYQQPYQLYDLIEEKSQYFHMMPPKDQIIFSENIFCINFEAERLMVQLLNIDIGTISYIPRQQITLSDFRGEQIFQPHYQRQLTFKRRVMRSINYIVRPIFQKISTCRVFAQPLIKLNQKTYDQLFYCIQNIKHRLTSKSLMIENHINAYNLPFYHWQLPGFQFTISGKMRCAYDIGNIGLVLCFIIFHDRLYNLKGNIHRGLFYMYYRRLLQRGITKQLYFNHREQFQKDIVRIFEDIIEAAPQFGSKEVNIFLKGLINPLPENRLDLGAIKRNIQDRILDGIKQKASLLQQNQGTGKHIW